MGAKQRISLRSSEEYVSRLESLIEATEHLNSTFDLDELLAIILDLTLKNLRAERGTIYLIDEERQELWSRVMKGSEVSEIRLPLGTGISGTVAAEGRTILLKDASKDERFYSGYDKKSGFITKSMLCHPMKSRSGKIVGVFQILNKKRGTFDDDDIRFLEAFSDHVVLAVENVRLVQASLEQERTQRDLQIAASIQQRIIPKVLPSIPGYQLSSSALPSKMVGGDFFDIIQLKDGTFAIIMADVSGKGIPASLIVSNLHASLRAHIQYQLDLEKLIPTLNSVVCETTTPESFITVFIIVLDPATHTFRYMNAGHNLPYIIEGNALRELPRGGLPLGLMESASYESGSDRLDAGATLVLYTDGFPEAMNRKKELYDDERFKASMLAGRNLTVEGLRDRILTDVNAFMGKEPASDDMTLLIIRRT